MAGASVFITGSSGFLGRSLLEKLSAPGNRRIVCLPQRPKGDILEPKSYAESLKGCDTVLHLAAVTGKQAPSEYFRVNRDGTESLLREAERAGVRRFVFVSSISAKFKNQRHYYYAQSKLQAESLVKNSRLPWIIVRPTMIFGKGSAVLAGLAKLASLPFIPLFGDGQTRVQPVQVADLAQILADILDDETLNNRLLEIGGPEAVSMERLMQLIRLSSLNKEGKVVHLPVGPLAEFLSFIEPVLRPVLPLTAGQLASFHNNGVADPDPWVAQRQTGMKTIKEMLASK
jgi:NADH dehydrogenase